MAGLGERRLFCSLDRPQENVRASMSTRAVADVVKLYAELAGRLMSRPGRPFAHLLP